MITMTKEELIKKVHQRVADVSKSADDVPSKASVQRVIEHTLHAIVGALVRGETVLVPPLGRLTVKERKATKARSIRTGAVIDVPAKKVVRFTTSKRVKEDLNPKTVSAVSR